jgi:ADP-heptose:LPS heptosyltransferase
MNNKYFFILGGGLGDAVMHYIRSPLFRKLPLIKEANPDIEVHVYSQVHNNGIEDLFWHHPVVNRHVQIVQLPQHKGYENFDLTLIPADMKPGSTLPHDNFPDAEPVFNLSSKEQDDLSKIFDTTEPVIVIQPFAGLSDRDAFDQKSLTNMAKNLPGKKVIVGSNAPRVCCERTQKCDTSDPSVVNLIDRVGIRFTYHLIRRCNAFIGCHSSLVLLSWHHHRPTVCVLPMPFLDNHWRSLDPMYKEGVNRENTLITSFRTHGNNCPADFEYSSLDCPRIAEFLAKFF